MKTPSPLANDLSLPFDTLGPYTLVSKIGKGGMGCVYLARHVRLGKLVALKTLPPWNRANASAIARFEQEMAAIGKLRHPNIISATDAGNDKGCHYLVMEYIRGNDLARLLRERSPLGISDVCEMGRQVALALACLQEHSLVHRDIKPSNLLLGEDGVLRVLDFGLAGFRTSSQDEDHLTASGFVMGTGDFIAPEQTIDSHKVDTRADIYSLGCTLYALFAGKPPFSGPSFDNFYKKVQAHQSEPIPPLRKHRPEMPDELLALIDRMLVKDPKDRIASPGEVASILLTFTQGYQLEQLVGEQVEDSRIEEMISTEDPGRPTPRNEPAPRLPSHDEPVLAPTPSQPMRKKRRWLVACGVAVAIAASLIGWGALGGFVLAPKPDPEGEKPVVFEPGVWYPLLVKPPIEILWPDKEPNAIRFHDPDRRLFSIISSSQAIFELANVEALGFDLEMTISQEKWTGGFGVYFRGRDDPRERKQGIWADLLLLERFDNWKVETEARLLRGRLLWIVGKKKPASETIHDAIILRPSKPDYRLALTVDARGVKTIKWDGQVVAGLADPSKDIPARDVAYGTIGLYANNCAVVFRSVRIRYHSIKQGAP